MGNHMNITTVWSPDYPNEVRLQQPGRHIVLLINRNDTTYAPGWPGHHIPLNWELAV